MARVLVVDDEQMIRWSIEETLRAAGYEVLAAGTVAEGLNLLQRMRPAVVFLDVRLPDASGLTLLQRARDPGVERSAVIVMTAYEESCTPAEALRLGAYGYLRKPFDFDQLEVIVHKALADVEAAAGTSPDNKLSN